MSKCETNIKSMNFAGNLIKHMMDEATHFSTVQRFRHLKKSVLETKPLLWRTVQTCLQSISEFHKQSWLRYMFVETCKIHDNE